MTPASSLRQAPLLLHISAAPSRPPQSDQSSDGLDRLGSVGGLVAEEAAVVHARRAHDLAGIDQAFGIEAALTASKRVVSAH